MAYGDPIPTNNSYYNQGYWSNTYYPNFYQYWPRPAAPGVCPGCNKCNTCGRPYSTPLTITYGTTTTTSSTVDSSKKT